MARRILMAVGVVLLLTAILVLAAPAAVTSQSASWALMIAGVGAAGAAMRRRGRLYRLVERHSDGTTSVEEFRAEDDVAALEQARSATGAVSVEVWQDDRRIVV